MAILFLTEPLSEATFSNSNVMRFTTTTAMGEVAVITVSSQELGFEAQFMVQSSGREGSTGLYFFDLREVVYTAALAQNGYILDDVPSAGSADKWLYTSDGRYYIFAVKIELGTDVADKLVRARRGVLQYGEVSTFADGDMLLPRLANGDFYCKMFDGYPFEMDVAVVFRNIRVVNNQSRQSFETNSIGIVAPSALLYADFGNGVSWTNTVMPLVDGENRLTLHYDETAAAVNLSLYKEAERCGVYLRWVNRQGGTSYWLFDKEHSVSVNGSQIGYVLGGYGDTPIQPSPRISIGSNGAKSLALTAQVDKMFMSIFEDLMVSPRVQLYTSQSPNVVGQFVEVFVEGTITQKTKLDMVDIAVSVDYVDYYTQTL